MHKLVLQANNGNGQFKCDFICDTEADIASLPINDNIASGSTAYSTADGYHFILSASRIWEKV